MASVLEDERRQELLQREENRQALLNADDTNLIGNDEEFECPICFLDYDVGEGVTLRECLHVFCSDCIKGHIESSETPEVKCPYVDDDYHCDEVMQEREIREIAPEFYPKLLERGLQVAESQAADSYHCKTLNCRGWCTYDDHVNFFQCPVCNVRNCLTCQAIHENQNCKEYQDDLKRKAANDVDARKTQDEIEACSETCASSRSYEMPECNIVIMKKTGCDWLKCSVCQTEICWVTKQARWGPQGPGDNSGGCKCRVQGPCHPNCGNCH
ncbi:RBCK1 [Bugula neritina]|uniref:RBCK1 n=1 Tax=Bugula neritina TaxID=10212 RepID=A0A7J7JCG5_BUGNE|nr:RBCK1 [Bugula neritina]